MIPTEQVSIFDLLEPESPPATKPSQPYEHAAYEMPDPCPACGEESANKFIADLNHWGMPVDRKHFGHEVCVSMKLKLNHLHHAIARAGRKWDEDVPCCYGKTELHQKRVMKPTREQWLDHARDEYAMCKKLWALHPASLDQALGELLERYGVAKDEFEGE